MDHVKKLVYTIVGCLTIVSLTFTICTKIGHCAESSDSPIVWNGVPYLVGQGIANDGYFSDSFILTCVDDAINRYGSSSVFICAYQNGSDPRYLRICFNNTNSPSLSNNPSNANFSATFSAVYVYDLNGFVSSSTNTSVSFQPYRVFESINGAYYYIRGAYKPQYPIYVKNYGLFTFSGTDTLVFAPVQTNSGGAHTKGGVLGNYIDSQDLLEDNSEVEKVDITPPADSSSIPGWLQKILGGLGTINGSIQSGVLTIGDYIGQLKESFENAIAWIMETPDSDEILDNIEPYLAQNDLISGFNSSKSAIQGVYSSIGNVSAKTRSQMVWDIPFNLPSMSQTFHAQIDFGWYENIRSTFEPFLNMFLMVGFLFSFLRSIPGILHGNSGEGDT